LAINVNRVTGLFGRSADTSAVRTIENLRPLGKYLNKMGFTADTAVNFFPLSAGFSGGAFLKKPARNIFYHSF
jgi:hypothetical protein